VVIEPSVGFGEHVRGMLHAVRSSADVMNTTLAPARMHFSRSRELCTPPVIPRSAAHVQNRMAVQCKRNSNSSAVEFSEGVTSS